MLILRVHFTEEAMDDPKFAGISLRFSAIIALFGKGVTPTQEHVEELRKNPRPDADEADDLFLLDSSAYNNLVAFDCDHASYINDLDGNDRQKVFLQRLAGLPEDPKPKEEPIKTLPKELPAPAKKPKPTKNEDPLFTSLRHLFNPQSTTFSQADVDMIDGRWRWKKGFEKCLSRDIKSAMDVFAEGVDNGDPEGYVDGIDKDSHPHLTDDKCEELKDLLRQLLGIPKATEPEPAPDPVVPVTSPARPVAIVAPSTTTLRAMPLWVTWLHKDPRCEMVRKKIEEAFQDSKSPNLEIQKKGEEHIVAWKRVTKEYADGCAGPALVNLGKHMLNCIIDLENNVDTSSAIYRHVYITS